MVDGKSKVDPIVLLRSGKYKRAVKILEKIDRKSVLDFNMKMRLAEAYNGAGRTKDAVNIYKGEAESRFAEGNRSTGVTLLKKAARIAPRDEELARRIVELESPGGRSDEEDSFSFDVGVEDSGSFEKIPDDAGAALEERVCAEEATTPGEASGADFSMEESVVEDKPSLHEEVVEKQDQVSERVEQKRDEEKVRVSFLKVLFPTLEEEEIRFLVRASKPRQLKAGEVLLREGDEGDSFFIVLNGIYEARGVFEGRELPLAEIGIGDVIGEAGFLKDIPRTATVTALESSEVLELSAESMVVLEKGGKEFEERLDDILRDRVKRTLTLLRSFEE